MTTVTINAQHLDGNDPEGFNAADWLEALESEYRSIAAEHFPDAEIVVEIDRQSRSSGYTRPVSVRVDDGQELIFAPDLDTAIEYAAKALYDARGNEFFTA